MNDDIVINPKDLTIILTTRGKHIYGKINNIDSESVGYKVHLNAANELSFTVHKEMDGIIESLWDKIKDLRLVYVKELNEYYQIKIDKTDSYSDTTKVITGTSLCEAELGQINIYDTEINTEDDIARDDYVVTTFYDRQNKKASLLDRIISFAPHYKIGHVDDTLVKLQRSFSLNEVSIYDFLTGECSEQFNCLFQFDSMTRTINVYDLYTNCLNPECGYRGEFNDVCPECGGTALSYFGEDTSVYVDSRNLADSIQETVDVDSVKNCFKVIGGDDDITAAIRNVNPNGTDIIYYITDDQKEEMSSDLVKKINAYDQLCADRKQIYIDVNNNIYEALDKILYYKSSMMPTVEKADVTANTEVKKLASENLSPLGLTKVNQSTSLATVNSGLKMLAKVFVKSGYVKVDIDDTNNSFEYVGEDEQHNHYGTWYGRFKVTNYSDEDDVAYSDYMEIKVYDLYTEFMEQKIKKNIVSQDKNGEDSIFDVLTIKDLDKFKNAIKLYSLARLTSFHDAIQSCLNILIEADQAKEQADMYKDTYLPYYNKLEACESEMNIRQATIDDWQSKYDAYIKQRSDIQTELNFENYLGTDLYNEFQSYKREDTYSNENYISDGLDNVEILKKAEELLDTAKKELYKSATKQRSINTTLYNLLQIKEFEPIRDKFSVGNWIRVKSDDRINRLRLVSYEVNGSDLTTINVEFSDVTVTADGMNDTSSIISKAQQMATSYSYVSAQAKKGEEARNSIGTLLTGGLNASVTAIRNADTEDVVIGKDGITSRAYDDINGWYDPKQLKIIHNMLVFTSDNWKTAETAVGEITYTLDGQIYSTYGVISKALISGIIVSGDIYSANYSSTNHIGTHIDLETGSFTLAGGRIAYTAGGNKLTLKDVLVEYTTEEGKDERTDLDKIITGQQTTAIIVDQIQSNYINTDNFYAKFAEIDLAKIKEVYIDSAFIKSLNAEYATIEYLTSKYLTATQIQTDYLTAKQIKSDYIATVDLEASIANINIAHIKELYANSAFITSLQAITSASITSTVDTQFVKDLIVGHATLNDLFTSNFIIGSDDGGSVLMNGSTMQFKDKDGNVYVQIGIDKSGGHSIIINDNNGTAIMNGSGITANAIADGLIVDQMLKKKDTNYNGITGDKLNIDSVVTSINNGSTTIKSSQIYFDEDKQTLNTKLATMQDKFSEEINNKISEVGIYQAWVESSNGNVLYSSTSTVLKAIFKKGNTIIDINGTEYRYIWRRRSTDGYMDVWSQQGKVINVSPNDFTDNITYFCEISNINEPDVLTDVSDNILTDASSNILTAPLPIISCEISLYKNINEQLRTNYYTKSETPDAVTTIIGQTDLEKVNGGFKKFTTTFNSVKNTVDSHTETIGEQTKTLDGMSTKQTTFEQTLNGLKTKIVDTRISNDTSNVVEAAENKTYGYKGYIEATRPSISSMSLYSLEAIMLDSNMQEVVNSNYTYSWSRRFYDDTGKDIMFQVVSGGLMQMKYDPEDWSATGKTVLTDTSTLKTYTPCYICIIKNGDELIMTCRIRIHLNTQSVLINNYYNKTETANEIKRELKSTEWISDNDGIKKISETANTAKSTAESNTATITKTMTLLNGNNLLRNSDTLCFDGYVFGSMLVDASSNILTDANGNILVA